MMFLRHTDRPRRKPNFISGLWAFFDKPEPADLLRLNPSVNLDLTRNICDVEVDESRPAQYLPA